MTADECFQYHFKTPFYPGKPRSYEDIYNRNPESHSWSGYYWITDGPTKVYCGMTYTGSSYEDIYENNPETGDKSGYYRINDAQWTYCNMISIAAGIIPTCAGVDGEWKKIVSLNFGAGDNCPDGWTKTGSFCRASSVNQRTDGSHACNSINFSTNGIRYQSVCGKALGYRTGQALGFYKLVTSVDRSYVTGLSITHGSPTQHIWTYASGWFDDSHSVYGSQYNCPCAQGDGTAPPSFVTDNYNCEAGPDVLWDGLGCTAGSCCDNTNQPWFHRQLNETSADDIRVKLCTFWQSSQGTTLISELELYVQ